MELRGIFSTKSFDSLAEDLGRTLTWIEDQGIVTSPTRLAKYYKLMNEVIEIAELRDLERANDGYGDYVSALYEAHEIVQCCQGLDQLPRDAYVERLRTLVSGPTWYSFEDPSNSSNRARNTAFELLVTSMLAEARLTIRNEPLVDVAATLRQHSLLIECKRPQSLKKLEGVIRDAKKQLTRRLKESKRIGFRGVVAIDITKLANSQFGLLEASSPQEARNFVEMGVSEFIDSNSRALNAARKPRVIAFLLRMSVIAECKDTNTLMYCQQWGLTRLPDLTSREGEVFTDLAAHLDATPEASICAPLRT